MQWMLVKPLLQEHWLFVLVHTLPKLCLKVHWRFWLPWRRQLGCPALLHWQETLNFNSSKSYNPPSNRTCHSCNSPQNRAGIFSGQHSVPLLQTPCCHLTLARCSFPPSHFPRVHLGMLKALLSFLRNLLCVHRRWDFFRLLLLGQIKPIFHLDTEM